MSCHTQLTALSSPSILFPAEVTGHTEAALPSHLAYNPSLSLLDVLVPFVSHYLRLCPIVKFLCLSGKIFYSGGQLSSTALTEDLGSGPSIHMADNNSWNQDPVPAGCSGYYTQMGHRDMGR